jgi:hypothetical protein
LLADFCNRCRRAGTPDERSILAREWSFRPATRRHQPMPVALISTVRCRTGNLRATVRSRRLSHVAFHLRGRDRLWAEAPEQRQTRGLGRFARALLVALRAPGSPARLVVRSGVPLASSLRPRSLSDASPRRATPLKRPRCFLPRWNPYVTGGLLLRARLGRSTVTPPPKRHCSGALAPFSPLLQCLPLTRKAPEAARPSRPWEPKPPGGLAGRCAHHDIYDRISSRADVPRTSWALSRTNQVSTQYKKHPNNAFFLHFFPTGLSTASPPVRPFPRVFPALCRESLCGQRGAYAQCALFDLSE